jgi:molybdopterin-guanine dinucleotide biosynthesis protein A
MSWSGLVFAGGESRRMGRDKALLEIGGATLLQRAVNLVRRAGGAPFVVGRRRPPQQVAGARQIDEASRAGRPACGPLMALRWGLADSGAERVLALACDVPFVTVDLIHYLMAQSEGVDVVVPRCGGVMHVLTAVYAPDCMPAIDRRLAAGQLAVHALLEDLRVRIIDEEELTRFGGARLLENINTPAQLARAKAALEMKEER